MVFVVFSEIEGFSVASSSEDGLVLFWVFVASSSEDEMVLLEV